MATPVRDKYYLKTLHEEIDLFDRKLAHMLKYEEFATDAARSTSAGKLRAKRELLARTARLLASEGIEFKESDLPRSFRADTEAGAAAEPSLPPASTPEESSPEELPFASAQSRPMPSPFEGTVLDGRAGLDAYKRSRVRVSGSSSR